MSRRRAALVGAMVVPSLLLASCSSRAPSALRPKGSEAQRIAGVWWLMFGLAAAVYVVVGGFIIVATLRGRGRAEGRPSRITDDGFIWVGGVIVPVLILMVLAVVTVHATTHLRRPEKGALRIEVTAKRWWWGVRYPQQRFETANEIHVPAGRPIELGLASDNVIHSFWVPQLGGKLDTIPGQHNVLRFKVGKPGTYRGQCAEFCGLQHARMALEVVADTPADFDRWALRRSIPPSGPTNELEAQGQRVFMTASCAGCHTVRGTAAAGRRGPDLTDFGSRQWIGSITVRNNTANLTGWVVDSQSIKPGNLMPPISLEPGDLQALVAYLQSLR